MPAKITPPATLIRVQELHDAGNSFRKIAEILIAEGVPAAGTRSKWHHDSVRGCLAEIEQRAESSATWGLSPQIRARLAAQGEEIEGLTVAGLQQLGTGIQETVDAELETIRNTTVVQTRQVEAQLQTIQARGGTAGRPRAGGLGTAFDVGRWSGHHAWVGGVRLGLDDWGGDDAQPGGLPSRAGRSPSNRIAAAKALMAELEKKTGGLEYLENGGDAGFSFGGRGKRPMR